MLPPASLPWVSCAPGASTLQGALTLQGMTKAFASPIQRFSSIHDSYEKSMVFSSHLSLLQTPVLDAPLSAPSGNDTDPILSVLLERIDQEEQLATPEQLVDETIARYLTNPEDLPTDADYREAIITYVDLVKKRHARRQQQFSRLRSHFSRPERNGSATEPLALANFYSSEPSGSGSSAALNGSSTSLQLAAASS